MCIKFEKASKMLFAFPGSCFKATTVNTGSVVALLSKPQRIEVGQKVRVVHCSDNMMDTRFFKKEGEVVNVNYNHGCGEIKEDNVGSIDPMYCIGFELTEEEVTVDGKRYVVDGFWREELEVLS